MGEGTWAGKNALGRGGGFVEVPDVDSWAPAGGRVSLRDHGGENLSWVEMGGGRDRGRAEVGVGPSSKVGTLTSIL